MEFREIRFQGPEDPSLSSISSLLNEEWTGFSPEQLFRKYSGNPVEKDESPHFICMYENGVLAAANGYLPVEYHDGDRILYGVQDCDSYVARAFRKRGYFTELVKQAESRYRGYGYDFIFGFPNKKSLKTYQNLGWEQGAEMRFAVRILNPSLIQPQNNTRWAMVLLRPGFKVWNAVLGTRLRASLRRFRKSGYKFEELPAEAYKEKVPKDSRFRLRLGTDYLRWRFGGSKNKYSTIQADGPSGESRILISFEAERRILRILAIDGTSEEARSAALCFLSHTWKDKVSRIRAWVSDPEDRERDYPAAGFLNPRLVDSFFGVSLNFLYKDLSGHSIPVGSRWYLRYVDSDTV